jgi:TolA-binding protein
LLAVIGAAVSMSVSVSPGEAENTEAEATIGDYYQELEQLGLVDVDTGSKQALIAELGAAEKLLQDGSPIEAAIALYAIVESPRFTDFEDFVEYQNAEYSLAVSLAASGAYDSALHYLVRSMQRGPSKLYFAPAHRRAVDIAIETREYDAVLAMLTGLKLDEPVPPGPAGEHAYLRARAAYDKGDYAAAEGELVKISRKSRLYSSSLYMRGVIRTRRGEHQDASDALCEIVDTPDNDRYTFVVDDRYFTIKDLARLGLGRIAHEDGRYDDAYYHYFQIPDDSDRLPEALFEAAWSMYQKRELATARDLVEEFLDNFPTSPLVPEAMLLAGYVELADCKFDEAQKYFDRTVAQMQPVVNQLEKIRKDRDQRVRLFDKALARWRDERANPDERLDTVAATPFDKVLAYLRVDPRFVRLHEAVQGMRRASGDAPHVVRSWRTLARRVASQDVGAASKQPTIEAEDAADANALLQDVRRLRDDIGRARAELRRGLRSGTLPKDVADEERKRLDLLQSEIDVLENDAENAAAGADAALMATTEGQIGHLIKTDLAGARALERTSQAFLDKLLAETDRLAVQSLDNLYTDLRRVLDKAKLGKIDAVIGQKRILDIEVQDLASGRFPPELHGQLWEQGLIGDDEEFWPFEGEMWRDEYEGWR